jgi:hypothetical protein
MRRLSLTRMGQREPEKLMRSLPGDKCLMGGCGGVLKVYTTLVRDGFRIRYLECSNCGFKPDDSKWVTAIER